MSEKDAARKPRAFVLPEEQPIPARKEGKESKAQAKPARKPAALPATVELTGPGDDPFLPEVADSLTPPPASPRRRGLSLGSVFSASLGLLLTLALGLWADGLIADLFARAPWLGWIATGVDRKSVV